MSDLKSWTDADVLLALEAKNKRIAEQDEQIVSLQSKVHLCAAYDKLEQDNERLRAENDAWQNQDLLEQSNRQADEIERLRAELKSADKLISHLNRQALRE